MSGVYPGGEPPGGVIVLARFWRQDVKAFRDLQVVLTLLTLNFLIPSFSYFFAPDLAIEQFRKLGHILGGADYPLAEQSHVWRVLAAGNVFTLGFLCFLLQLNVKRFAPVVPAFVVLKSYSALGYLYVFLFLLPYRLFFAIFLFDGLAVFLVVVFSRRALRAIAAGGPGAERALFPPLLGEP
jgi:hypothetical protein